MLKVGIIIPYYGGINYLPKLLESIFQQDNDLDIRAYIIDNSSLDGRLTDTFGNDKVFLIQTDSGIGYGKACNVGFFKCVDDGIEVAIIANQDAYFGKGAISTLVATLSNASDTYIAAMPLLTEYDNRNVEWFFIYVYLSKMPGMVSDMFAAKMNEYYDMPDLCGACFAIKVADYHYRDYLFDPIYHMYFEDADLYRRIIKLNKKVMLVPKAIFHHTHSNTSNYNTQTINDKAVHKSSGYIFNLIHSKKKFYRSFLGWGLLEFRRIVESTLKLDFRELAVEMRASYLLLSKLSEVYKRKK